jgi:hypothetical protein
MTDEEMEVMLKAKKNKKKHKLKITIPLVFECTCITGVMDRKQIKELISNSINAHIKNLGGIEGEGACAISPKGTYAEHREWCEIVPYSYESIGVKI